MLFHLVHEVGNRQRWRTKETLSHASAALIADQISGIAGVTGVSATPRTGSVIVTYDTGEARAALAEYLAGLAVGYWDSLEDVRRNWAEDKVFEPIMPADKRDGLLKGWHRAVKCALDWTKE